MKKHLMILLGLTLLLMGACKEEIEIDIPDAEPLLVVEARVTTEKDSSKVVLTLTSNYYSKDPYPIVKNADVSINGIPFTYVDSLKYYVGPAGYTGVVNTLYTLQVKYNNKTYNSISKLEPMFRVDSLFQTWKEAEEPFLPAGWAISYAGFDPREPIKYTWFTSGIYSTVINADSFDNNLITFDNSFTPVNTPYVFELPFARFESGQEFLAIYRSVDKNMFDFLNAFSNSSPDIPGPFQTPPANLPSNISNGAVGYFAAMEVQRFRYTVK
jgi:hypothetical protein